MRERMESRVGEFRGWGKLEQGAWGSKRRVSPRPAGETRRTPDLCPDFPRMTGIAETGRGFDP